MSESVCYYFLSAILRYSDGNSPVLFLKFAANLPALEYPTAKATCSIVRSVDVKSISAWLIRRCLMYSEIVQLYMCLKEFFNFVVPIQAIRASISSGRSELKWSLIYEATLFNASMSCLEIRTQGSFLLFFQRS